MSIGDNDVSVRRDGARGWADEGVLPCSRDPRVSEAHQQFSVLGELVELKTTSRRRGIVAKWATIACPEISVVIHAEPMRLDNQAVSEALCDRTVGGDVVDRGLGAKHHPESARTVSD